MNFSHGLYPPSKSLPDGQRAGERKREGGRGRGDSLDSRQLGKMHLSGQIGKTWEANGGHAVDSVLKCSNQNLVIERILVVWSYPTVRIVPIIMLGLEGRLDKYTCP